MKAVAQAVPDGGHAVEFYRDEEVLSLSVSAFLGAGLVAGQAALLVGTPEHRAAILETLEGAGVDVAAARAAGRFRSEDADALIEEFFVSGQVDSEKFEECVGSVVRELSASAGSVRVYGELVAVLCSRDATEAALDVERLWNALLAEVPASLLCGYPKHVQARGLICSLHKTVVKEPRRRRPRAHRVSRVLQPTEYAVPVARRFVRETLAAWDQRALVDATDLIVSELVGNAVRHAGKPFHLVVARQPAAVRVAVTDPIAALPLPDAPAPNLATSGRGLQLIAAVASRWGSHVHDAGKTVWAEVDAES